MIAITPNTWNNEVVNIFFSLNVFTVIPNSLVYIPILINDSIINGTENWNANATFKVFPVISKLEN